MIAAEYAFAPVGYDGIVVMPHMFLPRFIRMKPSSPHESPHEFFTFQ